MKNAVKMNVTVRLENALTLKNRKLRHEGALYNLYHDTTRKVMTDVK